MSSQINDIFDVIFFWDNTRDQDSYRQYCGETLCNVLGFTPPLSVKLIFEAKEKGRVLIMSTMNVDKAAKIRDTLSSLELSCQICPVVTSNVK